MKRHRHLCTAVILICSLAAPTSAQVAGNKQTPENAQKFLATVLVGAPFVDGRADIYVPGPLRCDKYTAEGRRWEQFSPSQIASAVAKARTYRIVNWSNAGEACQSHLVIEGQSTTLTAPPTKSMYTNWYTYTATFGQAGNRTITIDWSKITSANVSGNAVELTTTQPIGGGYDSLKGANQIKLVLPDEGMAARAGFAAEVIRLKCDATSGLGF